MSIELLMMVLPMLNISATMVGLHSIYVRPSYIGHILQRSELAILASPTSDPYTVRVENIIGVRLNHVEKGEVLRLEPDNKEYPRARREEKGFGGVDTPTILLLKYDHERKYWKLVSRVASYVPLGHNQTWCEAAWNPSAKGDSVDRNLWWVGNHYTYFPNRINPTGKASITAAQLVVFLRKMWRNLDRQNLFVAPIDPFWLTPHGVTVRNGQVTRN